MLEIIQDITELDRKGANLGLGLSVLPSGIGGQLQNGKRHVVENLSGIIGTEKIHIVVANALMLNGAMMANAQRDESGRYTEHGNLVMKVGELFIKNIYDYDNGYTFGASVNFARRTHFKDKSGNSMPFESLEATVALHKGDGWTFATIGQGEVECTKPGGVCELDKANRDVTAAQDFDMEIDIKPVFLYFTTLRLADFDLPGSPKEFFKKAYEDTAAVFTGKDKVEESSTTDEIKKAIEAANEKSRRIGEIDDELRGHPAAQRYFEPGNERKRLVLLYWIDELTHGTDVTTEEAFESLVKILPQAEKAMPPKLQTVAFPLIGLGIRACMVSPACASSFLALLAAVGHEIGKITTSAYEKIMASYESGALEKHLGESHKGAATTPDKSKSQQNKKHAATATPPNPHLDPDDQHDNNRKVNPTKAESKIWNELKPYRGKTKTNGLTGSDKRYYQWDHLHNEIEMYDKHGNPIDALDPRTGARLFKDVRGHKPIDV